VNRIASCFCGSVARAIAGYRTRPYGTPGCWSTWGEGPLIILFGQYAVGYYLGKEKKKTLTETVRSFSKYLPRYLPVPHSSWRSRIWMKKNPWFETV
jgi:hypothetical protein